MLRAERVEQSARSFAGKHELLLALFEESVQSTVDAVWEKMKDEDDALERLHLFVVEYYRRCRPPAKGKKSTKKDPTRALAEFAQQLLPAQPTEAARAFAPLVALFEEVLTEAESAGYLRSDLAKRQISGVVLEAIMFNAFSATIGGATTRAESIDPAEELWDLVVNGIGVSKPTE